ncbi:hypothetical protein IQ283_10280 [Alkalihalobacillus hwajinpoensis]|uniref:hypothetical protein n=1 Tax=Guptibacillus hwajinpoensis TaxID=208199 RepID=UPI001883B526|nr:hypothetical protein [Pseudalkalibacillus hwajinpoensis]MBF0706977.1 hypothetical protein [Pseudalkalibacillus hwajinpoensis]
MKEFDELIQQQLKLADQMIRTKEEILSLEDILDEEKGRNAIIVERKEMLSLMEDEFERLISDVISTFEKTPIY